MAAGRKTAKFNFLGGGLVTRPTSNYIAALNKEGKFYATDIANFDTSKIAGLRKRHGYESVGGVAVSSAIWLTQGTPQTTSISMPLANSATNVFCMKVTAPSTAAIARADVSGGFTASPNLFDVSAISSVVMLIKADSAGSPGITLATSGDIAAGITSDTLSPFYFSAPVSLTNATDYWFCIQITTNALATSNTLALAINGTATSGTVKYGTTGYSGYTTNTSFVPSTSFQATTKPCLGIYDYRPQSGGSITQFPMVAVAGTLYYYNGSYNSIKTGLASAVNSLYDFSTLKNLLFSCDYATSNNQAWDGAASSTMTHGYRGTFSIGQSASAGGPWSAAGIVKVMLVTQLRSGGYRCSAVSSITLAGTTNKIDLTSIAVDAIAAQFSFDIAATATTIYCTLPNGSIFYKVPAASLSTAGNPIANTQTTNSILPMTDATLIAGGSFEANLTYPQGYATGQVDTPKAKYMDVFQNMLCTAGDPNNPSRVWFSEQGAPQVWGDGSSGTGIQGDYLDIAVDDGELITGLAVSDGALMVGKPNAIYRVDYTGNAFNTWTVNKVHGQVGVLSNWTMQIMPDGLFFLSARGPAVCYGTYSDVLPQTRLVQNLFSNLDAGSFALSSMAQSTATNDTTRNRVIFGISSNGSTIRDRAMFYDYEQKMFGLYDAYQPNYIASVGDTNGFPVLWTGDLSGCVYKVSATNYYDSLITGITMPFAFYGVTVTTPSTNLNESNLWKQIDFLYIAGPSTGLGTMGIDYLYVDVYLDNSSTVARTIALDMATSAFTKGVAVRLGLVCREFSLRFRLCTPRSAGLDWVQVEYTDASGTRMG